MLSKERRIPRKMFPLLSKGAKMAQNKAFLFRFVPNTTSRFCFSISKKVAKSAVVRNRMRRAGYRLLKEYMDDIKPNILGLFIFRTVLKSDQDIAQNIKSILKESKLI